MHVIGCSWLLTQIVQLILTNQYMNVVQTNSEGNDEIDKRIVELEVNLDTFYI